MPYFYQIYEIPTMHAFAVIVGLLVVSYWLGLLIFRPFIRLWISRQVGANSMVSAFLSYFGVIYGLLLGLLSVAVYQNKSDVERTVVREAASLSSLYRDISAYPEPICGELQRSLREYTRAVIHHDWPQQQRGLIPSESTEKLDRFHDLIIKFKPNEVAEEIIHAEAYSQFNKLVDSRRFRLYSVNTGIPMPMWYTLLCGAVVNHLLLWAFDARLRSLFMLGGILTFFNGMMIALIAVMDNPFRGGELSTSAFVFRETLTSLMQ